MSDQEPGPSNDAETKIEEANTPINIKVRPRENRATFPASHPAGSLSRRWASGAA